MGVRLSGGFTMIEEGTQVLKITKVDYNEDFGKIKIVMENEKGAKHFENFSLLKADGSVNENACMAFSVFARNAKHDAYLEEVEPTELVGCFLIGEIVHESYTAKDGSNKTTSRKKQGTYWEECPTDREFGAKKENTPAFNLDTLLDD